MSKFDHHSQFGQTAFVLRSLRGMRDGFFVELGADDGVNTSNTLTLERKYGWLGICIEPVAARYKLLQSNRTCKTDPRCVAGRDGDIVRFKVDDSASIFSGIVTTIETYKDRPGTLVELTTVTLNTVFRDHDAPEIIDYMSLDTEGSELQILQGTDLRRYRFRVLTVEHNHQQTKRQQIKELLTAHDYCHVATIGVDDCYFHRMLVPASVRWLTMIRWKPRTFLARLRYYLGIRTRIKRLFGRP